MNVPIPYQSAEARFYIAISEDQASSSYESMSKAMECLEKESKYADTNNTLMALKHRTQGIIKVDKNGRKWVLSFAKKLS